jgi:LCP family protein required for cell wall assembly
MPESVVCWRAGKRALLNSVLLFALAGFQTATYPDLAYGLTVYIDYLLNLRAIPFISLQNNKSSKIALMEKILSSDITQPIYKNPQNEILIGERARRARKRKRRRRLFWTTVLTVVLVYFLAPYRTNILMLGTDDSPARGQLGRTDTIMLTTIIPLKPYVGALGIPRDLWVQIPGVGEQRINSAYFFAEAAQPGSGAGAAVETIRQNFGVTVDYYVVLHMFGLVDVIDALGGIDVVLDAPQGGLPAGTHHLDGTQALALVRERYSADDFSRMQCSKGRSCFWRV